MRFTINKDDLKKALDVAVLAVTKDAGVITSSILFEVEEGSLTLWSTDRRAITKVPAPIVEGSLQGSGSFTVEAHRLSQWVSSVMGDEVDVDTDTDVVMTCGRAKGHFTSLDPASFPDFRSRFSERTLLFEADASAFRQALAFVRPFIGEGTSNNAVANQLQVAELRGRDMMATDSYVVSLFKMAEGDTLVANEDTEERFKAGSDEIRKVVQFINKTCDSRVTVYKSDIYIIESDDGSVFGYSEPVYNLPNIPGLPVELSEPEIWKVDKKALQNAIKALTATANKDDMVLTITSSGSEDEGNLNLVMSDATEKHVSTFDLPCGRTGEGSLSLKVNHKFLTDAVAQYASDDVLIGVSAHAEAKTRYIKLYEGTEDNHVCVCLITLKLATA